MASLLSMKLKPSKSVLENTEELRKKIISQSSLPTTNFSRQRRTRLLGIVHKRNSGGRNCDASPGKATVVNKIQMDDENNRNDKVGTVTNENDSVDVDRGSSGGDIRISSLKRSFSLVGDYGSTSESD
ncbi:hypothetical protein NQ317_005281 [Molorchus minor]|uniref:Uncharacterized protein n=1 Tax=Molorchus minor TaxID=1323400 RepID=A0ABQ9JY10_9CUCU|nr:hypothetical protein NQ317_005281 [Molorchus minor]